MEWKSNGTIAAEKQTRGLRAWERREFPKVKTTVEGKADEEAKAAEKKPVVALYDLKRLPLAEFWEAWRASKQQYAVQKRDKSKLYMVVEKSAAVKVADITPTVGNVWPFETNNTAFFVKMGLSYKISKGEAEAKEAEAKAEAEKAKAIEDEKEKKEEEKEGNEDKSGLQAMAGVESEAQEELKPVPEGSPVAEMAATASAVVVPAGRKIPEPAGEQQKVVVVVPIQEIGDDPMYQASALGKRGSEAVSPPRKERKEKEKRSEEKKVEGADLTPSPVSTASSQPATLKATTANLPSNSLQQGRPSGQGGSTSKVKVR